MIEIFLGTVLARRAFILFLHGQIRNHDAENSIVERSPTSNKFRLKVCLMFPNEFHAPIGTHEVRFYGYIDHKQLFVHL